MLASSVAIAEVGTVTRNEGICVLHRLHDHAKDLIELATIEARVLRAPQPDAEHLLLAALATGTPPELTKVFGAHQVNADDVRDWLTANVEPVPTASSGNPGDVDELLKPFGRTLGIATGMMMTHRQPLMTPELLCYAALKAAPSDSTLGRLVSDLIGSTDMLARQMVKLIDWNRMRDEIAPQMKAAEPVTPTDPDTFLDQFAVDLVTEATEGRFDPHVGREREIGELLAGVLRRTKSNVVLIGEPGVGKTAIVEGLAQQIAAGTVPDDLANAKLWSVDVGALTAGTRRRGDFEERAKQLIAAAEADDNAWLFIDELHQLQPGAGGSDGPSFVDLLKPALSRGSVGLIGATTVDEYRRFIERDPAFARRFRVVHVNEPSVDETIEILNRIAANFATHHQVSYTPAALAEAVTLSNRLMPDRQLPDKAIDVIDEVGSRHAVSGDLTDGLVDVAAIRRCVADMVDMPLEAVDPDNAHAVLHLADRLRANVFDQDHAVEAVANAVRRRRSGLGDPNRPLSFLFTGTTGTGKTELARTLAAELFGQDDRLIQIDMSEYMEAGSIARLIGAPPGYVGHDEPGQLTEPVRRKRSCVVLLDEIDKAATNVDDLLLQILEEGRLTDATGRVVDFSDTVVIATCNVTGAETSSSFGFGSKTPTAPSARDVHTQLLRRFRPEQLNRFDELVQFNTLSLEAVETAVDKMVEPTRAALAERNVSLHITGPARRLLAVAGYEPTLGMRPLRRAVQAMVADQVAELLLAGALPSGATVTVDDVDGTVVCSAQQVATKELAAVSAR